MNEHLVKFWLFATHWTELDTFDTEEELRDEMELLHRQNLPTKVRQRTKKDGGEELVLNAKGESVISYADYAIAFVDEIEKGAHIGERISVVSK